MDTLLEFPDEEVLVGRARAYDESAIRSLIRRYNRRLYRLARGVLRDDAEAEDALQDAYLKAFAALGDFRGESALGTWLGRIVLNEALGRLRRRKRTMLDWASFEEAAPRDADAVRADEAAARPDPERTVAQRQIRGLVERAIDTLPDDFRMVLIARIVEEMSVEETAALLDLKPETVKTRLHRARALLRDVLSAEIGSVLGDSFPFGSLRCERLGERVVAILRGRREPS